MKPTDGRRTWIKLWVNDWLEGTTRYQMSDGQRAFWIDLLAMAGRSRFGGIVCSGKDGDRWIGYPLVKFQGLLSEPIDVLETFELFRRTGKITLEVGGDSPKLYTVFVTSWARYQSEYQRQKHSRSKRVTPENTKVLHGELQPELQPETRQGYTIEEEAEGDPDSDGERETDTEQQKQPQTSRPAAAAAAVRAFKHFRMKPFGNRAFQAAWVTTYENLCREVASNGQTADAWTAAMEETITFCQENNIKVPPLFFELKRKVEKLELDSR